MDKFEKQIRSINYAIKELQRELNKARETKDKEWIVNCEIHIENLTAAKLSVEAVKALQSALAG